MKKTIATHERSGEQAQPTRGASFKQALDQKGQRRAVNGACSAGTATRTGRREGDAQARMPAHLGRADAADTGAADAKAPTDARGGYGFWLYRSATTRAID